MFISKAASSSNIEEGPGDFPRIDNWSFLNRGPYNTVHPNLHLFLWPLLPFLSSLFSEGRTCLFCEHPKTWVTFYISLLYHGLVLSNFSLCPQECGYFVASLEWGKYQFTLQIFICLFGDHSLWCSGVTLALHSGISPSSLWGLKRMPGTEPRSAAYKASTLPNVLLLCLQKSSPLLSLVRGIHTFVTKY